MSNVITRFFKGSCPSYPEGQTVTVHYNNSEHKLISTTCPDENKCTVKTCPIKDTISLMYC